MIASHSYYSTTQINEAFASQFAYCVEQLEVPIEKINPKFVVCLPQALLSVLIV